MPSVGCYRRRMTDAERLRAIAEWLDSPLSPHQEGQLLRFVEHLKGEGVDSGAVSPSEAARMVDRHIGDSLVYLSAIDLSASTVLDVGSGIGLPGIPIAIGRPDLTVTLLDRSQRRIDQARRTVRILSLGNVETIRGDASGVEGRWDVVVFRASLGITDAAETFRLLSTPQGTGVFGVSRLPSAPIIPEPPDGVTFELRKEAAGVLDSPSWLLRMRHQ